MLSNWDSYVTRLLPRRGSRETVRTRGSGRFKEPVFSPHSRQWTYELTAAVTSCLRPIGVETKTTSQHGGTKVGVRYYSSPRDSVILLLLKKVGLVFLKGLIPSRSTPSRAASTPKSSGKQFDSMFFCFILFFVLGFFFCLFF